MRTVYLRHRVSRPILSYFGEILSFETSENFHCRPFLLFLFVRVRATEHGGYFVTLNTIAFDRNYDTHRGFNTVTGIIVFRSS